MNDTFLPNRLREAMAAARSGDRMTARTRFREILVDHPDHETALLWAAGLADSAEESLTLLLRVEERFPENAKAREGLKTAFLQAGAAALHAGDRTRARTRFAEAVRRDPNRAQAWLGLAGVSDEPAEAVRCLERSLALDPSNESAAQGLKTLRERLAQPPTAPAHACPFCECASPEPIAVCRECRGVARLDDPEALFASEADPAAMLARVERWGTPENYLAKVQVALALVNARRYDEAEAQFKESLASAPDAEAKRNLGRIVDALVARREAACAAVEPVSPPDFNGPRKTVLLVDDNPTIRKLVVMTLEQSGHLAMAAGSVEDAMEMLRINGIPDVLVIDADMPGTDGYRLCRQLRQQKPTAHMPIVLLMPRAGVFGKLRAKWAGSDDFVLKPFQPKRLLEAIDKVMARRPIASGA